MKVGDLLIDESEIVETFVRSSGPGGQNVNKVASAVELRLDARRSASLPDDVAARLIALAGARATQDGVIVIFAQRFSRQPRNREDARARLASLIEKAQAREKPRRPTRPSPDWPRACWPPLPGASRLPSPRWHGAAGWRGPRYASGSTGADPCLCGSPQRHLTANRPAGARGPRGEAFRGAARARSGWRAATLPATPPDPRPYLPDPVTVGTGMRMLSP